MTTRHQPWSRQMGAGLGEGGRRPVDNTRRSGEEQGPLPRMAPEGAGHEQRGHGGVDTEQQNPGDRAGVVGPRCRIGHDEEPGQAGAHDGRRHPVRGSKPSTGPGRPEGQGEEQPAHQQRLNHHQRSVAEGHKLKDVAGDVAGEAQDPNGIGQQADQQAEAKRLLRRLGGCAALLQHGRHGVHERSPESAQDRQHGPRLTK